MWITRSAMAGLYRHSSRSGSASNGAAGIKIVISNFVRPLLCRKHLLVTCPLYPLAGF
jgi:hypothetical protein